MVIRAVKGLGHHPVTSLHCTNEVTQAWLQGRVFPSHRTHSRASTNEGMTKGTLLQVASEAGIYSSACAGGRPCGDGSPSGPLN